MDIKKIQIANYRLQIDPNQHEQFLILNNLNLKSEIEWHSQ